LYRKATQAAELQECALVKTLRKVLFLHAAVWGVAGFLMAWFPSMWVNAVTGSVPLPAYSVTIVPGPTSSFVRLLGVDGLVLGMFMVLIAQRIETVWWWSWAFVLADVALVLISVLHVLIGLPDWDPATPWWILAVVSVGFAAALLWGLFKAAQDQPIIDT
jgi:hypothetical protein